MDDGGHVGDIRPFQRHGCGSRACSDQSKCVDNRRSLRSLIGLTTTSDVIRHDATLLICRTGQGHESRLSGYEILNLNGITDGVDVGIRRTQILIHGDAAPGP